MNIRYLIALILLVSMVGVASAEPKPLPIPEQEEVYSTYDWDLAENYGIPLEEARMLYREWRHAPEMSDTLIENGYECHVTVRLIPYSASAFY